MDVLSKRGVRNPSALCYLIAPLQQLLNSPQFSSLTVGNDTPDLAVVRYLASWLTSDLQPETKCFLGIRLWQTFYHDKDGDIHTQRDAAEFYGDLIGRLTQEFSRISADVAQEWKKQYVGQLVNTLKAMNSVNPLHRLEKAERFYYISVTVNPTDGLNDLESALRDYTRTETVPFRWPDAETKQLGAPAPTGKTTKFRNLPQQLAFHLKRFRFDQRTMRKEKLHHRFDFPAVLDMTPYMDALESGMVGVISAASATAVSPPQIRQLYRLSGVVVHRGRSAYSGHYYSFIRDRHSGSFSSNAAAVEERGSQVDLELALQGEVWHCFDDDQVTQCDSARLAREALGRDLDTSDSSEGSEDGSDEEDSEIRGEGVVVQDIDGSNSAARTGQQRGAVSADGGAAHDIYTVGERLDATAQRADGSAAVSVTGSGSEDTGCEDSGSEDGGSDSNSYSDSGDGSEEDEDGPSAPRSAFMLFYERM